MRRELRALVLVVAPLSFVSLVSCGAANMGKVEQLIESGASRSKAEGLAPPERELLTKSYLQPQEIIERERDVILKSSLRYRQRRIEEQQEDLERNIEIMSQWLKEDFKALTQGSSFSPPKLSNLLELNLTKSEQKHLKELLDIEADRKTKFLSSLLQPALESFDDLYNTKLKELRLLEEEASLEAKLFSARLELHEADSHNWRFGSELSLYLFGFKWLWGVFSGYKQLTFSGEAADKVASLEAELNELRESLPLRLESIKTEQQLALKVFKRVFASLASMPALKASVPALENIELLLPALLKQLGDTARLVHERESLIQTNYLVINEVLKLRTQPEKWGFRSGEVNSIFRNILSYQLTNSHIGFNGLSDLIGTGANQFKADDFSVQAINGDPELALKTYQNPDGTPSNSIKEQAKIWPQFVFGSEIPLNQSLQIILAPWILGDVSKQSDLFFNSRSYDNIFINVAGNVISKTSDCKLTGNASGTGCSTDRIREFYQQSLATTYESWDGYRSQLQGQLLEAISPEAKANISFGSEIAQLPNLPQISSSTASPVELLNQILKEIPKLREQLSRVLLEERSPASPTLMDLVNLLKLSLRDKAQLGEEQRELENLNRKQIELRRDLSGVSLKEVLLFTLGFKWLWGAFTGYAKSGSDVRGLLDHLTSNIDKRLLDIKERLEIKEMEYNALFELVLRQLKKEINRDSSDLTLREAYSDYTSKFIYIFTEYEAAFKAYSQELTLFREYESNAAESYSQFANLTGNFVGGYGDGSDAAALINVASDAKRRVDALNAARLRLQLAEASLEDFSKDESVAKLIDTAREIRSTEIDNERLALRERLSLMILAKRGLRFKRRSRDAQSYDWDSGGDRVIAFSLKKVDRETSKKSVKKDKGEV